MVVHSKEQTILMSFCFFKFILPIYDQFIVIPRALNVKQSQRTVAYLQEMVYGLKSGGLQTFAEVLMVGAQIQCTKQFYHIAVGNLVMT